MPTNEKLSGGLVLDGDNKPIMKPRKKKNIGKRNGTADIIT
jgi:hypothetical protein